MRLKLPPLFHGHIPALLYSAIINENDAFSRGFSYFSASCYIFLPSKAVLP